jgi:ClpP class serine protease
MKRINVRGFLDVDHARLVATAIERCAGSAIDLRIDSPGGQYGAAVLICLAIEEHTRPVTTTVCGQACSAAYLVALRGDFRRIDKRGTMMMH